MAIKRYYASKDNTITNAYKGNLMDRGVSGNMGQSDILEVFHIYGQQNSASIENCRILIEFDIDQLSNDRGDGNIPASGSVDFFLKLYNAEHSQTTPKNFDLIVSALSQSWEEGNGLDMEEYSNEDASNWISASEGTAWLTEGGDYWHSVSSSFTASFDTGFEDMDLNITPLVEQWINSDGNTLGFLSNYGVGVRLPASEEAENTSYYTKRFFARGSQFFFKRPVLEARWDSSKKDDRYNFYLSSSLVPASENLMNLYLYNVVKGQLTNIPAVGTGSILVSIYSGSVDTAGSKIGHPTGGGIANNNDFNITGAFVETGIYSCSFAYTSSVTNIFDVWHLDNVQYHTGSSISVSTYDSSDYNFDQKYVSNVTNLRATYTNNEEVRIRLYVREKDWSPTIYSVASKDIETSIIDIAYYKIVRVSYDLEVVPFGTGSLNHTRLSYDKNGGYFDLSMGLFDVDTVYELSFAYLINGSYVQQPERFRFRVE